MVQLLIVLEVLLQIHATTVVLQTHFHISSATSKVACVA
jgi:hypothetical protein